MDISYKKKGISMIKDKSFYRIYKNDELIYKESIQHVTASSKLMRIPNELWLRWAEIVINQNDDIKKISLKQRLQIFKKSFENTIAKDYSEKLLNIKTLTSDCLNCGTSTYKEKFEREHKKTSFYVYICSNCGLGVKYPRKKQLELQSIYEDKDYFSGKSTKKGYYDYEKESKWRITKAKKYLKDIEKITHIKPKSSLVLDIGAGFGYFLKALKDSQYSFNGVEPATEAINFAKNNYKINILKGDVISLYKKGGLAEKNYDLITMWDVIEHLYDFNDDLKVIVKLLKPGGYIALRTNNIDSIEFKVFGKYFHSIKDEHTFYFNKKNLIQIFKKYNIHEVKTWTHTHLFLAFMSKEERNEIDKQCLGGDIFFVGKKI